MASHGQPQIKSESERKPVQSLKCFYNLQCTIYYRSTSLKHSQATPNYRRLIQNRMRTWMWMWMLNVNSTKDLEIKVDLGSKWIIWLLACMWIYEATYYEGISDWALNVTLYKHSCSTSTRTLPSQIRCNFSEYNAWRLMKDWPNVHNCTGCTSHHHLGS